MAREPRNMLEVLCEVLSLLPKKSETFRLILAACPITVTLFGSETLKPLCSQSAVYLTSCNAPCSLFAASLEMSDQQALSFRGATDPSAIRWETYCFSS